MAKILRVPPIAMEPGARRAKVRRKRTLAAAWATLAAVFCITLICVSPAFFIKRFDTQQGEIWVSQTVVSPFDFTVVDNESLAAQRSYIERHHDKVFRLDSTVEADTIDRLDDLLELARLPVQEGETTAAAFRKRIRQEMRISLDDETARTVIENADSAPFRSKIEAALRHVYRQRTLTDEKRLYSNAMRSGRLAIEFLPRDEAGLTTPTESAPLEYPREAVAYLRYEYAPTIPATNDIRRACGEIAAQLITPNLFYDNHLTLARKHVALQNARPQIVVLQGERIISPGERVDARHVLLLGKLDEKYAQFNAIRTFGNAVFVVLAMVFLLIYARTYHPELSFNAGNVLMASLPTIIALVVGRVAMTVGAPSSALAYAFPAGMVGMLGVILFNARLAMVIVMLASMLFGVTAGMQFPFFAVSLIGGFTGAAGLQSIRERRDMLLAGLRLVLVNVVTILAVGLARNPGELNLGAALGGIINGLVCYVLTLAILPVFETVFRITTDVRLMELTSTNHPLLDELELRAPGSFQHSLNVAKLAEPAADAVGANFLLVRTGAYFHDIGKMLKPKYFSENQVTPEERRIHAKLSPYMSNLIIKNHVKDGIELARKYRLPEKVVDFIPQHQGTGLIRYFFAQARQRAEPDDIVPEDEFRYPGPKPQSIEAAIVMLADTVEATAMAKFSGKIVREDDLRKLVHEAINEKFNDEQFDECPMRFHDLHKIRESFVQTLLSRYHHRVDYPSITSREPREAPRAEKEKAAVSGSN